MRIIQITDLHINSKDDLVNGVDTRGNFINVLKRIKNLTFDFVVITGDLSFFNGDLEVYNWIKKQLNEFGIHEYFVIGGNHDDAELLAKAFDVEENLVETELYYFKEPNFVFLDTIKGYCNKKQLHWFEKTLKECNINPIIFMHHPPFSSGVPHMDKKFAFQQSEQFFEICKRNSNESYVFCGHYHNEITVIKESVSSFITPSTYLQIDMFEEEFKVGHYVPAFRIIDIEKEQIKTTVVYVFN